jgi:hypothetical protein
MHCYHGTQRRKKREILVHQMGLLIRKITVAIARNTKREEVSK